MQSRLRWLLVSGIFLAVLAGIWWWSAAPNTTTEQASERVRWSKASQFTHYSIGDGSSTASADRAAPALHSGMREPEQVEQVLFEQGSLRGTALDGDWGIDANGQLQPSRALRRRFDQLLTTQGEVSREELGVWLRAKAIKEVGASAAHAIMQIWHKYLTLEGQDYRYAVRLDQSESLQWALQERQIKRREILGVVWAEAFYAEEEALLIGILASRQTQVSKTPTTIAHAALPHLNAQQAHALRSAEFGTAAADRLAELDRQETQWQARLAQARAQWASINSAVHLSQVQQQTDFRQWLEGHFDETEQMRVRALLGL